MRRQGDDEAEARALAIINAAREGRGLPAEEAAAKAAEEAAAEMARGRTVGALIEEYLSEPTVKAARSYSEKARYLRDVLIELHELDSETCCRWDITLVLRRIAAERGQVTANRARSQLSAAFAWGMMNVVRREQSPVTFTPRWGEQPRDRKLTLDELGAIWRTAPEADPRLGRIVRPSTHRTVASSSRRHGRHLIASAPRSDS